MKKVLVYKKAEGCPSCKVLDLLIPRLKVAYPDVEWEFVVIGGEGDANLVPKHVGSFPTSILSENGEEKFTVVGYDQITRRMAQAFKAA